MKHNWLRAGFFCLLFGVVAGCTSSGKSDTPQTPSNPPAEKPEVFTQPKPPEDPPATSAWGRDGPNYPGTNRPVERTLYFDYDRAVIKPADLAILEVHAQALRGAPNRRITIQGHCDERGTREYNLALGERRADAVRAFLLSSRVSRSQIEIVSFGEERPADPGHDENAWSKNRRAVLQYR